MMNMFVWKKRGILIMLPMIGAVSFVIGDTYYGLIGALGFLLSGMLVGMLIGGLMLRNPFTDMLEGRGILCLDLNSTGVIRPFIVGVRPPFIEGFLGKERVSDTFNRSAVFNLAPAQVCKTSGAYKNNKGGLDFSLDEEEYNKGRFALYHYPCILYNQQTKTVLTKDWFSEGEKKDFAEHHLLYMNRKLEELTSSVRDFARYIVEMTRPKTSFFSGSWWIYVIVGVVVILLLIMFGPAMYNAMMGAAQGGGVGVAAANKAIVPISG